MKKLILAMGVALVILSGSVFAGSQTGEQGKDDVECRQPSSEPGLKKTGEVGKDQIKSKASPANQPGEKEKNQTPEI